MEQKKLQTFLKCGIFLCWSALVLIIISYFWQMIPATCPEDDTANLCRNYLLFYFSIFTIFPLIYGFIVTFKGHFLKFTVILLTVAAGLGFSYWYSAKELSDIRTYGYEIFIISFYLWLGLMGAFFIASLLFRNKSKPILISALIITISATAIFTLYGRGGSEHIIPIIGGLAEEISWKSLGYSKLIIFCGLIIAAAFTYTILAVLFSWIIDGRVDSSLFSSAIKKSVIVIAINCIAILSVPPGIMLNNKDAEEAKMFLNNMIPAIKEYYAKNQYYPKILTQAVDLKDKKAPWLIDRHQYLIMGVKGSYYFSRPDKFCMIFQNPGKDFGYYSITSDRDWKFVKETDSLENTYISLCDDDGPTSHEGMLASYLGLKKPNDPLGPLSVEADKVQRIAATPETANKLENTLVNIAEKDPSVLAKRKVWHEMPTDVEGMRQLIMDNTENDITLGAYDWEKGAKTSLHNQDQPQPTPQSMEPVKLP